jgi:hypothetical protein
VGVVRRALGSLVCTVCRATCAPFSAAVDHGGGNADRGNSARLQLNGQGEGEQPARLGSVHPRLRWWIDGLLRRPRPEAIDARISRGELRWVIDVFAATGTHLGTAEVFKPTAEVLHVVGWKRVPVAGVELTGAQVEALGARIALANATSAVIELVQGPNYSPPR